MNTDRGGPGRLIVVVGPSGVGKDSLIDYAKARLEGDTGFGFVRRVITRPTGAGGEDHLAVSRDDFARLERQGAFAVSWSAHGLSYGIPVETKDDLRRGVTLVVNGSRGALPAFLAAYERVAVVSVTADPTVIAERLHRRGREGIETIRRRLERAPRPSILPDHILTIDNSGALDDAGERFVATLISLSTK